jgi:flavin reductase (DIM6/NTAB) family NADH-FMN oxidoreductase RutF
VSAAHDGVQDVMAAAWACGLDFSPPKLTVVLDKSTHTRVLVENAGTFVVQIPTVAQAQMTHYVGNHSLNDEPGKLEAAGTKIFHMSGFDLPFVSGCAAWLACRLIPEPHNQTRYDLFIAEIIGAWADSRVFRAGHWEFARAEPALRTLHYIAGGQFYAIGDEIVVSQ